MSQLLILLVIIIGILVMFPRLGGMVLNNIMSTITTIVVALIVIVGIGWFVWSKYLSQINIPFL